MAKTELDQKIADFEDFIYRSHRIVFFGGAGVSTESGIPDFRSATGIFTNSLQAEEIVSHDYFFAHTEEFYKFYKSKMMFLNAKPNPCHIKLAQLEKTRKKITIITQNIDGLHQLAGSHDIIELHGTIHSNHCLVCGKEFSAEYVKKSEGVPKCDKCGGLIKPDVVLYGESLDYNKMEAAAAALADADLLIVGGTSLKVYPAASFISFYKGKRKVFINKDDNPLSSDFLYINAKIGEVFSKLD